MSQMQCGRGNTNTEQLPKHNSFAKETHSILLPQRAVNLQSPQKANMIPLSPESISATHVEYFPLPASCFASAFVDAYGYRYRLRVPDSRCSMPPLNGKAASEESSMRTPAHPAAVLPATTFSHYLRGPDLRYAPHVHVPAAESIRNCPTPEVDQTVATR